MSDECRLGGAIALVQNHRSTYFFTQRGMRAAEGHSSRDRRMSEQDLIDFMRRDVLAAADDDVFDPASQMQVTIGVQKSLISGAKPSIHKCVGVRVRIIFIAAKYIRPLNRDLASLIRAEVIAVLVHDADAQPGAHADRTSLAMPRRRGFEVIW